MPNRLPVRWDRTTIVVMNEVRVSSPYLPESVSGGTPAANERVRKVVRNFKFEFSEVLVCVSLCVCARERERLYEIPFLFCVFCVQLEFEKKRLQSRTVG